MKRVASFVFLVSVALITGCNQLAGLNDLSVEQGTPDTEPGDAVSESDAGAEADS